MRCIADIFEREHHKIDELTQSQFRVLRQLRGHKRATIIGGAGTGKTLLAIEKATQLAEQGFRVLLVCFNRNLKDWITGNLKHSNIVICTFHGLVQFARRWAKIPPSWKKWS
jgi:DNA replication protein DnaC